MTTGSARKLKIVNISASSEIPQSALHEQAEDDNRLLERVNLADMTNIKGRPEDILPLLDWTISQTRAVRNQVKRLEANFVNVNAVSVS